MNAPIPHFQAAFINSTGAARKSLSDDLREARIRLSIIRSRQRRGVYAGQDVNFVSLLDLQTDAHNLGFDLSSNRN